MLTEVTKAEANLPGPPFLVRQQIQVIEHPRINRTASGTNLRSSHAALLALSALHQHCIGGHVMYAEEKPIEPLPAKDGLVSHVVTLFARASGLQGPGKPAQVTAEVTGSEVLTVTGTLTSDGTTPLTFPPIPKFLDGPKPEYRTGGTANGDAACFWIDDHWVLVKYLAGETRQWTSSMDVATPDLVTNWAPTYTNTGTPVVTRTPNTALTLACATAGASIRYTTDGSYPSPAKTLYTAPFALPAAGTVIRAAAYKTGLNPGDATELTVTP